MNGFSPYVHVQGFSGVADGVDAVPRGERVEATPSSSSMA